MNIFSALDRLTEPQFAASVVRTLTREEIEALQTSGRITPLEMIPARNRFLPCSVPASWGRGKGFRYYAIGD